MSQIAFYLDSQEAQQLDEIVGNIPTKHGYRLVQFFDLINQKRQAQAQADAEQKANAEAEAERLAQKEAESQEKKPDAEAS